MAICIGTGSEVCAQKVHVIRRSQISTGLKTVFKPDKHKTRKDLEAFLKAGIVPKKGELKTLFQYQLGNGRAN